MSGQQAGSQPMVFAQGDSSCLQELHWEEVDGDSKAISCPGPDG